MSGLISLTAGNEASIDLRMHTKMESYVACAITSSVKRNLR